LRWHDSIPIFVNYLRLVGAHFVRVEFLLDGVVFARDELFYEPLGMFNSFELLYLFVLSVEVVLVVRRVFTEVSEIVSLEAFQLDFVILDEDTSCLTKG
jgi:hypothetical protein